MSAVDFERSILSAAWRGQKGCGNEGFYGGL